MPKSKKTKTGIDSDHYYAGSVEESVEPSENREESFDLTMLESGDISSDEVAPEAFEESAADGIDWSKVLPQLHRDYLSEEENPDADDAEPADAFLEKVIGRDDRKLVVGSTLGVHPFKSICHLRIQPRRGSALVGTGWFINSRVVITAGHCVFRKSQGGFVQRIILSTRRSGGPSTGDEAQTVTGKFFTTKAYTQLPDRHSREPEYDYGAIVLPRPFARVGAFGYAVYSKDKLRQETFNVVGYPGEKRGTMYGHAQRLDEVRARDLTYTIDTTGGQSGSPLFDVVPHPDRPGDAYVSVGIHNAGSSQKNFATRVNREVFENLEKWRRLGESA